MSLTIQKGNHWLQYKESRRKSNSVIESQLGSIDKAVCLKFALLVLKWVGIISKDVKDPATPNGVSVLLNTMVKFSQNL